MNESLEINSSHNPILSCHWAPPSASLRGSAATHKNKGPQTTNNSISKGPQTTNNSISKKQKMTELENDMANVTV